MLTAMDESIGFILQSLQTNGYLNDDGNTLIVFMGDNGGPMNGNTNPPSYRTGASNYPLRGGKSSTWEGEVLHICCFTRF